MNLLHPGFSQAANAHFGVYLWGLATNHKPLSEMGEAMLLMEAHSSKYYWCAGFPPPVDMPSIGHIIGVCWQEFGGGGCEWGFSIMCVCVLLILFTFAVQEVKRFFRGSNNSDRRSGEK